MIPKNLFFIWLGNKVPAYAEYAVSLFKQVNPNFEITFIKRTDWEIDNISKGLIKNEYDEAIYDSISYLNNKSKYEDYINTMISFYQNKNNLKYNQILSDILRLELVNRFGGIYLDCDTFPIKPFDDNILSLKRFCVSRHFLNNEIRNDNYFFGSEVNENIMTKPIYGGNNNCDLLQTTPNWFYNSKFLLNKKKFFDCSLKYGEFSLSKEFYIEHYNVLTREHCCK